MSRLQAEQQRLFLRGDGEGRGAVSADLALAGRDGLARAMVLEVAGRGAWSALAGAWQGVQADLQLPAPAIAVSGGDAYQLWFSLSQPVPATQAASFLEGLRRRYLGEVEPERVRMMPSAGSARQATRLPPVQVGPERWSAFVTVDLAAVFGDEPWLDLPPTPDAQAELLARLHCMEPADLVRALEKLAPSAASPSPQPSPASGSGGGGEGPQDPKAFLLAVMNDGTVELKLRIEAARALLPYCEHPRP